MAYTLAFSLNLGSTQTGLTLKAQLVDTAGTAVGSAITTGFVGVGLGNYLWTGSIPDGHRGGVKFLLTDNTLKAFAAVNPEEAETLSAATCNKIADHQHRRTQANVEASSDGDALDLSSQYGQIQQSQKSDTTSNPDKLTVFKTDGDELGQLDLESDATADPVTGVS